MASTQSQASNRATLLVAFMWGAYFLNYCDRQAIFSMFPVLEADLAMSDQQLGLTGSVFLWVYGLGCPLAGQIADRYSKRILVVLSLAIWSGVTIATGLATSATVLLLLRAAMGVSESLYMPAAIALTSNAHPPEKRSRAISALTTAQIVGTIAGAWFGGWMANQGMWREAFFVLGGAGLLYAIPYFMFLSSVNEASHVETRMATSSLAASELFRVPTFVLLCLVFPTFVFGLWMLYSWLPSFLFEKFSLSLTDAAFTATAYLQSATFVGLLCGGLLADKLFLITKASRLWIMAASLLLSAPCLHGIGSLPSLQATCVAATAFGLLSGFFIGNVFAAAFEVVPGDTRASAVGLLNFFGALVSGFAPLVGGTWKETLGIEQLLTYTSCAYLATAALLGIGICTLYPADFARARREL